MDRVPDDLPSGLCHLCWAQEQGMMIEEEEGGFSIRIEDDLPLRRHMSMQPPRFQCVRCGNSVLNAAGGGVPETPDEAASMMDMISRQIGAQLPIDPDQPGAITLMQQLLDAMMRSTEQKQIKRNMPTRRGPYCHGCFHLWIERSGAEGGCGWTMYQQTLPEGVAYCGCCGESFPVLHQATKEWVRGRFGLGPDQPLAEDEEAYSFALSLVMHRETARQN